MISTAKLRYLRIAPRKVRLVTDLIRGKTVEETQAILRFTQKKAARPLSKLLKQALANAKDNFQIDEKNLYISKLLVDEGPKLKRFMPRARGKADEIHKKTSHITLVLGEIEEKAKKREKAKKPVAKKVKKAKIPEKGKKISKKEEEKTKKEPQIDTGIARKMKRERVELEKKRPKRTGGLRKFFRRKAF
jgi:large subunit ribosomal protein L22